MEEEKQVKVSANWAIGISLLFVATCFILGLIFFYPVTQPAYFADNATVMYFYSDSCHACNEIKPILIKLGDEGFRLKPMNIDTNRNYLDEYNILGTPTFVFNNHRISGINKDLTYFENQLRAFLEDTENG